MTQLHHYLSRLQNTLTSRQELQIILLEVFDRSNQVKQSSEFYAQVRFFDGSQLHIVEKLVAERHILLKARYAYHYQQADGTLIFRYDDVPHHREVATFPHHKHIDDQVIAAQPPDLHEVLQEIDMILYLNR